MSCSQVKTGFKGCLHGLGIAAERGGFLCELWLPFLPRDPYKIFVLKNVYLHADELDCTGHLLNTSSSHLSRENLHLQISQVLSVTAQTAWPLFNQ